MTAMHYVLLATHTPETCPTSNSKTRELLLRRAPEMPDLARKAGVKIVAGPLVNREHVTVVVVEAAKVEALDQFISESGLSQWNSVRVLPSLMLEEAIKEVESIKPIF
jgi:uncharacterized protein with GYD domain